MILVICIMSGDNSFHKSSHPIDHHMKGKNGFVFGGSVSDGKGNQKCNHLFLAVPILHPPSLRLHPHGYV